MNITKFNDHFEGAIKDLVGNKAWREWSQAPLFTHKMQFTKAVELARERTEKDEDWNMVPPLPFPMVRLELESEFHDGIKSPTRFFATELEGGGWQMFFYAAVPRKDIKTRESLVGFIECLSVDEPITYMFWSNARQEWVRPDKDSDTFSFVEVTKEGTRYTPFKVMKGPPVTPLDNLFQNSDRTKSGRDAMHTAVTQAVIIFTAFAVDVMAPVHHIAEVRPATEGKSIEWIKARTHYTIITHDHPANDALIKHGAKVKSNPQEELHRMAHSRRAHYRTLKSDRYKYAKGSRIFIRSTWVGPKEWQDEGSRQVYKILEPVEELKDSG